MLGVADPLVVPVRADDPVGPDGVVAPPTRESEAGRLDCPNAALAAGVAIARDQRARDEAEVRQLGGRDRRRGAKVVRQETSSREGAECCLGSSRYAALSGERTRGVIARSGRVREGRGEGRTQEEKAAGVAGEIGEERVRCSSGTGCGVLVCLSSARSPSSRTQSRRRGRCLSAAPPFRRSAALRALARARLSDTLPLPPAPFRRSELPTARRCRCYPDVLARSRLHRSANDSLDFPLLTELARTPRTALRGFPRYFLAGLAHLLQIPASGCRILIAQPMPSPPMLYGTAWKGHRTAALVEQAIRAGFRGVDTACQPKVHLYRPLFRLSLV